MKTHIGSLQRKNAHYYLVLTVDGKQRWIALRTTRLLEARQRAAMFAPVDADDEGAWLLKLVQAGKKAQRQLLIRNLRRELRWDNLWQNFTMSLHSEIPPASEQSYCHWTDLLAKAAGSIQPCNMTEVVVHDIAVAFKRRYVSANRILRFYARVWDTLGLDGSLWRKESAALSSAAQDKKREYYRRLTVEEVRRVVAFLSNAHSDVAQEYAAMIVIGFGTGLRLSDVAQLERAEVAPDGLSLQIVPNKVRRRKPHPLTIPLIGETREVIAKYLGMDNRKCYLFSATARARTSKAISRAFRLCDIRQVGNGRASFHSLRATFISLMDEVGVTPHITDVITGHAGGGMHARYTHPTFEAMSRAIAAAIPPVMAGH